jgi:two-component system, sensor histidine kinase YesM
VATMLRYSTSTSEGPATLGDELAHLKTYLFLMKQRFEDQLEYTISVESEVLAVQLPRIVLQPIIENSFTHGYAVDRRVILIEVLGRLNGDRWMIELQDNGNGFSAASMEKLRTQIGSLQASPDPGILKRGLDIGGLGLISTYARLYLFYHGDVDWEMGNRASGGAFVSISGPLSAPERP